MAFLVPPLIILVTSCVVQSNAIQCFKCSYNSQYSANNANLVACADPSSQQGAHFVLSVPCSTTCYYRSGTSANKKYVNYDRGCSPENQLCVESIVVSGIFRLYTRCVTGSYNNKGDAHGLTYSCFDCDFSEGQANDTDSCISPDIVNTTPRDCTDYCTTSLSNTSTGQVLKRRCSSICPADAQCCISKEGFCNNACFGPFCPTTPTTTMTTAITTTSNTAIPTTTTTNTSTAATLPSTWASESTKTPPVTTLSATTPSNDQPIPGGGGHLTPGSTSLTCYDCSYKKTVVGIDSETCKHPVEGTTLVKECGGLCMSTVDPGILSESYERRCSLVCADADNLDNKGISVTCCDSKLCNTQPNGAPHTWFITSMAVLCWIIHG